MTTAIQAAQPQSSFQQFLAARKPHIAQVLPKHMTPDRVVKVALTAYNRTPQLASCSMQSIFMAIMQASELGLEPGGALGHVYLVPYGNQCQFILGYRGMIELARRSGEIESLEAHVVHANDMFDVEFGLETKLRHKPCLNGEAGELCFVYALAKLKGGAIQFEVMTKADIEAIKNRSRASRNGPWVTDYEEMARKTVVRRLFKYLPVSCEKIADALEAEQGDYIDGEWTRATASETTPPPEHEPTPPPVNPTQRKGASLAAKIAAKKPVQQSLVGNARVRIVDQATDGSLTHTDPITGEVYECEMGSDGIPRVKEQEGGHV